MIHNSRFYIFQNKGNTNSTSQTLKELIIETGNKELIYSDPGTSISAGSVAVEYSGELFIGQIFEENLMKASKR